MRFQRENEKRADLITRLSPRRAQARQLLPLHKVEPSNGDRLWVSTRLTDKLMGNCPCKSRPRRTPTTCAWSSSGVRVETGARWCWVEAALPPAPWDLNWACVRLCPCHFFFFWMERASCTIRDNPGEIASGLLGRPGVPSFKFLPRSQRPGARGNLEAALAAVLCPLCGLSPLTPVTVRSQA